MDRCGTTILARRCNLVLSCDRTEEHNHIPGADFEVIAHYDAEQDCQWMLIEGELVAYYRLTTDESAQLHPTTHHIRLAAGDL